MIKAEQKFDIHYLDASSMNSFNRCPAKYCLSRLMGLESPSRNMLALDYGTDMHEALPYCYSEDTVEMAIQIFNTRFSARSHDYHKVRNTGNAERTILEFTSKHAHMCPYTILDTGIYIKDQERISKNELPFIIDIGGPLVLAGRMDAAVRWNADNSLWALDYKTTGELSDRLYNCFENSPQAIAYTLALSHVTNDVAKGLIVEGIRVSKTNAESSMKLVFIKDHQIKHFICEANNVSTQILECNEKQEWPMRCSA